MQLKIENIGMIQYADVRLDGLTVIAGENDTGKSTVGRLLFAIVKALSRYEQDLEESKEAKVNKIAEDLYFFIRRVFPIQHLIREFHPEVFIRSLATTTADILDEKRDKLLVWLESMETSSAGGNVRARTMESGNDIRVRIQQRFDKLKEILLKEESQEDVIKSALRKTFFSEFYSEITPKKNNHLVSKVAISEGESEIVDMAIQANEVCSLRLSDDLLFDDATFIESPIYLQLYNLISYADTLLETNNKDSPRLKVALHVKDLVNKMESAKYPPLDGLFSSELHKLEQKISSIVGGKGFKFSADEIDFLFYKTEDLAYRPINTASGVKAFGIIQLLLNAEILGERRPLIVDEPETHLHPAWQVKYAEVLVELVKYGIPVLLTSHSPYLIQALKVFSEQKGTKLQTHFYLAERVDDNASVISEVTDDLNQIFTKLSKPLQELVWT
jgi:predicted ATPase